MSEARITNDYDNQKLASLDRRVQAKRDDIDAYLAAACTRRGRLAQTTIIAGSFAAALTAAPALGGKPVSDWLTRSFGLSATVPAWRILCLVAMICSLAATIATQLHKSNNYDEYIMRAQSVRAALEALDCGIASGHFNQREATDQYMKCIENSFFIGARGPSRFQ
jgi:hypothetical protein